MVNCLCISANGIAFALALVPFRLTNGEIDWKRTISHARMVSNGTFKEVLE